MGLTMKPEKMVKFLEYNGYIFKSHDRTSHCKMKKGSHSVPVPMHSGDLDIGMISKILNETHIPKKDLLKWLGR